MAKRLPLVLAMVLVNLAALAQAFALVIGASDYKHLRPLPNSHQDAVEMAAVLKTYGFEVALLLDPATNLDLESSIAVWLSKLREDSSVGLIYYSGHGIQVNGANFLIPTQANPGAAEDIPLSCYNLDSLFRKMTIWDNGLKVVVFEASHDNPLTVEFNLSPIGLSEMKPPGNTLVASSAMPNAVTLGSHVVYKTAAVSRFTSPSSFKNHTFTRFLIETMRNRNAARLEEAYFRKILSWTSFLVSESTNGKEVPWISDFTEVSRVTPHPSIDVLTMYNLRMERRKNRERLPPDTASVLITYFFDRWARENLNADRFANGDPIPEARSAEEWKEAYRTQKPAWAYWNNDSTTSASNGKLYNYYAMSDPRGFVNGWRLPTWGEWIALSDWIHASPDGPDTTEFKFSLAGFREADGSFKGSRQVAYWWTKTNYSADHIYSAQTSFTDRKILPLVVNKKVGFSIRLIKE